MKRRLVGSKSLDFKTLVLATVEVMSEFTTEEIVKFKKFEDFFAEIDTWQAYEEEWDAVYYRPYYLCIYKAIKGK